MEMGKQMMSELQFWKFDPMYVGSESDEEGLDEEDITQLLAKGIDGDEHSEMTMAERMIASFDDEGKREIERDVLMNKELNISRF